MIGPLSRELTRICRAATDELGPGPSRDALAGLAARLAEPRARIAVGGRMNAGKSTLVNALLRQRLAATGATETTTLVTWFRYGHQDRLRLHLRNGSTRLVAAAPGGGVPTSSAGWRVDPAELTHITVEASNSALDTDHTIIDTPGLDSPSNLDQASLAALAHADAVIYLMPHPGEKDVEAVDAVRSWSGTAHFTTASMVGVLSRIDTLATGDEDPWPPARRVAGRYSEDLRSSFSDVLPVSGLLAETALGGEFSESETRALTALGTVDRFDLEDALASVDAFVQWEDGPISADARRRLLALLGLYGVRRPSTSSTRATPRPVPCSPVSGDSPASTPCSRGCSATSWRVPTGSGRPRRWPPSGSSRGRARRGRRTCCGGSGPRSTGCASIRRCGRSS